MNKQSGPNNNAIKLMNDKGILTYAAIGVSAFDALVRNGDFDEGPFEDEDAGQRFGVKDKKLIYCLTWSSSDTSKREDE